MIKSKLIPGLTSTATASSNPVTETSAGDQRITGLPVEADLSAHTLILGSMPGKASLNACQYYAHPRNLFWPLICQSLGISPEMSYAEKMQTLKSQGYALWDVIAACERNGSLDISIRLQTLELNSLVPFLERHCRIERIFFNGKMACSLFMKHIVPKINAASAITCQKDADAYQYVCLPSSSPANAAISRLLKEQAWQMLNTNSRSVLKV